MIFVVGLMCLVPPWNGKAKRRQYPGDKSIWVQITESVGYHSLFNPPKVGEISFRYSCGTSENRNYLAYEIDLVRLVLQCLIVVLIGGGALVTAGKGGQHTDSDIPSEIKT